MPHIQQLARRHYGDDHLAEAAVALAEHHGTRKEIEAGRLTFPDLRDLAVHIITSFPDFLQWLKNRGDERHEPPARPGPENYQPPEEQ
jgi:hypothetical protein